MNVLQVYFHQKLLENKQNFISSEDDKKSTKSLFLPEADRFIQGLFPPEADRKAGGQTCNEVPDSRRNIEHLPGTEKCMISLKYINHQPIEIL